MSTVKAREAARDHDKGICAGCRRDIGAEERVWLAQTKRIRALFAEAKPEPGTMPVVAFEDAYARWRQAEEQALKRVVRVSWDACRIGGRWRMLCGGCIKRLGVKR